MNDAYVGLEPIELWRHFDELNKIPRPSGHEAGAREYVKRVAEAAGYQMRSDSYGNCVVYVPARGLETSAGPVCVQAHLDMVKATAPGVTHDFENDPIVPHRDGDRIVASGTTLGADNGIGAAGALALITDTRIKNGPLELLFTVEEETGLKGASALDGALLSSKYLINLDSEDPSTLTIGCAGGESTTMSIPVKVEPVPAGWVTKEVRIGGLRGGHSGVEIHKNLANAIKLLPPMLAGAGLRNEDLRIVSIDGGSAHNAVPKEATVKVALPNYDNAWDYHAVENELRQRLNEPGLTISLADVAPASAAMSRADSEKLIQLLASIPTGVLKMSNVFSGKVQTSCNLAVVHTHADSVEVLVSIRSFVADDIAAVEEDLRRLAQEAGGSLAVSSAYPSWEPNPGSKLLRQTMEAFEHIIGKPPIVEVIHAGLECGVISAKVAGMEAISFGPTITGAHTPEEAVYPESVMSTWKLLVELLRRLAG
jgi:dipeptidase D